MNITRFAIEKKRIILEGNLPSVLNPPKGCPFNTRCQRKIGSICETEEPPNVQASPGHEILCHIPLEELNKVEPVISTPAKETQPAAQ